MRYASYELHHRSFDKLADLAGYRIRNDRNERSRPLQRSFRLSQTFLSTERQQPLTCALPYPASERTLCFLPIQEMRLALADQAFAFIKQFLVPLRHFQILLCAPDILPDHFHQQKLFPERQLMDFFE